MFEQTAWGERNYNNPQTSQKVHPASAGFSPTAYFLRKTVKMTRGRNPRTGLVGGKIQRTAPLKAPRLRGIATGCPIQQPLVSMGCHPCCRNRERSRNQPLFAAVERF